MREPRKTVRIRDLVEWVNTRNSTSTCEPEIRRGWNSLVDSVLMAADCYAGFGYLRAEELEGDARGQLPGIIPDDTGENRHRFPDETRIRFYIRKGL